MDIFWEERKMILEGIFEIEKENGEYEYIWICININLKVKNNIIWDFILRNGKLGNLD